MVWEMNFKQGGFDSLEYAQICEFGSDEHDEVSASIAYRESALEGNSTAQYFLALAYAIGLGVRKNRRVATAWFRRAVESGEDLCNLLSDQRNPSPKALVSSFKRLIAD